VELEFEADPPRLLVRRTWLAGKLVFEA